MKLYPELMLPRLKYILADLGILLWSAIWVYVGNLVYNAVMTLAAFGNAAIATGHQVHNAIAQVQQTVAQIPLGLGPALRDSLNPLYSIPNQLISSGQNEVRGVEHLSLVLGVIVAAVPLLLGLLTYIPWRVRTTRGLRSLNRMLRRPGASSAAATTQVLAGRALYTLPYDHLLQYSPDPILEWREGRYYNLARAAMAAEGLDVRRYLRRVEGVVPPPPPLPHDLPTIADEG